MSDQETALVENLRASLTQAQNFVLAGVASSFSFALLVSGYSSELHEQAVKVPGLYSSVDMRTAAGVALVIFWFVGMFAAHSLGTGTAIIRKLMVNPELVDAATKHPSIVTNPFIGLMLIFAPPFFVYIGLLGTKPLALQLHFLLDSKVLVFFLFSPYALLVMEIVTFYLQRLEAKGRAAGKRE